MKKAHTLAHTCWGAGSRVNRTLADQSHLRVAGGLEANEKRPTQSGGVSLCLRFGMFRLLCLKMRDPKILNKERDLNSSIRRKNGKVFGEEPP